MTETTATASAAAAIAAATAAHPATAPAASTTGTATAASSVASDISSAEIAATQKVTLADWCRNKSKQTKSVELVSAFHALETAKHHLIDTSENFEAAYETLRTTPAK